MSGLVPAIHAFLSMAGKDVDGRDKPGQDGVGSVPPVESCPGLTYCVLAGLVPAIHASFAPPGERRGCPGHDVGCLNNNAESVRII